jgi:hypothetical protein
MRALRRSFLAGVRRVVLTAVCGTLPPAAVVCRGDTLAGLTADVRPPRRFAAHAPAFSTARETFFFAHDGKEQEFWCIKDGGRYVAVLHEGMAQLDMITFDPAKTVAKPAFQSFYSWGTLLGTRILVSGWIGDWRVTGKLTLDFATAGETLLLKTEQSWPDRKGSCRYAMTLRVDPVAGYVWDIRTEYDTDRPATRKIKRDGAEVEEFDLPQFFNWQVRVTGWTTRHGNPRWPAAWTHERTLFQRTDGKFVGFHNNPDAVDRSRFKRTEVMEGGFVAMGPDADGWGIALCHLKKTGFSTPNATCNMWADSHNLLKFKDAPDADGLYRVVADWRFQAVPPEVLARILAQTEMDLMGKQP